MFCGGFSRAIRCGSDRRGVWLYSGNEHSGRVSAAVSGHYRGVLVTRVDPDSLRAAARVIGASPTTGSVPTMGAPGSDPNHGGAATIRNGASGVTGLSTAVAMNTAADSCEQAHNVVGGRLSAWVSILTTAADTFSGTDEQASKRVAALGDFNGSSDVSTGHR